MNRRVKQLLLVAMAGSTFIFYQNCSPGFEVAGSLKQSSQGGLALVEDIAILSPSTESPSQDQVTLNGRCSTGINVEVSGDIVAPASAPCLSKTFAATVELSGTDGLKTVSVAQTDASGTTKRDNRTFRKDRKAPVVALTAPVANAYASASLVASGVCEAGLNVSARIGTVNYTLPCSSGMFSGSLDLASVAEGANVLSISQTDLAGNVGSAQQNFIKDSVRPVIAVSSPAANATVTSPVSIQGTCEAGSDVQLSGSGLTSAIAAACSATGTFSVSASLSANNGSKSIDLNQTDRAGNSAVAVNLIVNRQEMSVPPAISITSPAANTLARTGVTLSGSCVSGLTVTISGSGVSTQSTTSCTNGAFSSAITFSNGDGSKTVTVSQTNASGTVGSDSRTFLKDNTPPVLTIVSPAANQVFVSSLTIAGACENGLAVVISGTGLSAAVNASCANGSYSSSVTLSAGDGAKAIQVRQTDAAANVTTVNVSVVKDATSPVIAFSSPAANTEAETGLTIAGSCETGLTVVINGSGVQSMTTTACASGAFSSAILFSAVDGNKVVDISQTDASGNRGQASRTFVRKALVLDGAVLYTQNCQSCHGALASSAKRNRTASQISAAIASMPTMNFLSSLTAQQIDAIALALKDTSTVPNGTKTLYACDANLVRNNSILKLSNREFRIALSSLLNDFGSTLSNDTQFQSLLNNLPSDVSQSSLIRQEISFSLSQDFVAKLFDATYRAAVLVSTASGLANYPNTSGCLGSATITQACHKNFVRELAGRAFRRSLTTAEVDQLATSTWNASLAKADLLIETFGTIASYPDFIYKAYERGLDDATATRTTVIAGLELANKLSFFLTGAPADAALRTTALAGGLDNPTTFSSEVDRLMMSASGQSTIQRLFRESYGYDVNDGLQYGSTFLNGASTQGLQTAMVSEMDYFFVDEVLTKKSTFATLMTSRNAIVPNSALAQVYGSAVSATSNITLPVDRSGFLSRAAFLTKKSGYYTSPVRRGKHIMERVLCESAGAPPPNAPAAVSEDQTAGQLLSTRTRYENLTMQPGTTCIGCHQKINPYGFALEGFDSLGRKRTQESIFNTSTGEFLGTVGVNTSTSVSLQTSGTTTAVADSVDLANGLATSDKAVMCFAKHLKSFDIRQTASSADFCHMNEALNVMYGSSSTQGSIYDAIKAYVSSRNFKVWKY